MVPWWQRLSAEKLVSEELSWFSLIVMMPGGGLPPG